MREALRRASLLAVLGALTGGCRDSSGESSSSSSAIPPAVAGSNGCAGASQVFAPGQVPSAALVDPALFGAWSQIAAARDAEVLYATTAGAGVVALDFSLGAPPVQTVLLTPSVPGTPGTVDLLLAAAGIASPAELSGIAVLTTTKLVAMEHTANVIVMLDRAVPDDLQVYSGLPLEADGFADGLDFLARFAFDAPSMLCPTADGRLFAADSGNHAVRVVAGGVVSTVAGAGAPFYLDGDLGQTFFDTPTGLAVGCGNQLLVSERGDFGAGGQRIRALVLGPLTFFGQEGSSSTLFGNGVALTAEGVGVLAGLDRPVAPVVSVDGETYWIDSGSGTLRRAAGSAASANCPLFADCATALAGAPTFAGTEAISLALSAGGVLYALDAGAATLWRVTP